MPSPSLITWVAGTGAGGILTAMALPSQRIGQIPRRLVVEINAPRGGRAMIIIEHPWHRTH